MSDDNNRLRFARTRWEDLGKTSSQGSSPKPVANRPSGGSNLSNLLNQEVAQIDQKINFLKSLPNDQDGLRAVRKTGIAGTRDQQLRILGLNKDRLLAKASDGQNDGVLGDIGSAMSSGMANIDKGIGYLAGNARLQNQARRTQEIASAEMTDYGRQAREKGVLGDDMGLGQRAYAALLGVAESTPELVGGALATAAIAAAAPEAAVAAVGAKILSQTPRLAKLFGATAAMGGREAAQVVGKRAIMTVAGMGIEGTQAGLSAGSDVTAQAIEQINANPEAFAQSTLGKKLIAENNGDFEAAKIAAANQVGRTAALSTGATTALMSIPASVFEARILSGGASRGTLKELGVGTAAEMGEEAPQSGSEQLINNVSMRRVGSDVGAFEGVAKAAGEGAIVGGLMGGGIGAGASAINRLTGNATDDQPQPAEDEELATALAARGEATPPREGGNLIEDQNAVALRGMDNISAGGMNYTPAQILDIARNNESNPRIADIMSQPVSDVTKVQQVARILNQEEVARVEPEAVRRISGMFGGTNSVSTSKQMIADELAKISPAIIAESPTLSAIAQSLESTGKQFVSGLRNAVSNYQPTAPTGTLFARPERGGEGSVILSQEDVTNEAQREREAQQAFRLADVRQRRFDTATGELTQREDLRAGAPEPEAQFFLNPAVYGEDLGGIAATIVGAEGGKVRIQYESPTELDGNGTPVIISEDVDPTAMFDRVVRGTARMTQELAGDVRKPRKGTGTDLNPRQSVDRTSTRAIVPTESGLPATISPTRMTGFEANTDQMPVEQNAQTNPQQERAPNVEGNVEGPNEISGAPAQIQAPAQKTLPAPDQETAPAPEAKEEAPAEDDVAKVEKHVENIEDKILNDDRNGVVRYANKVHKEGLIDDADLAEIKRMSKDKDMGAEDIGPELISQLNTKRGDGGTRYSGRRDVVRPKAKKASDVVQDTPLSKDKTAETEQTEQTEDKPKPDIDYEAVIQDRLDKIAARGGQGRIVASRLRSLLKQNNYNPTQLYYAFQMGEIVSRVLPKGAKVDVLFVPSVKATDADAAAASGIELGEDAGGEYQAYDVSQNGFRGLITLSLNEDLSSVARENAAHEAFHVIQDMLRAFDPDAFNLINNSFRDNMRIDDLDASILRKLKTLKTDGEGSVYDNLIADFGDAPLSRYEAQAVAFGALVDAKDRGVDMKGLKASFIRVVDFVSDMLRGFRNLFDKNGVESIADIFEGYRTSKAQESMTEAAPLRDGEGRVQYSGRKKPPYEHPSIGKQKINPPIADTSTIPFLYDNGKTKAVQVPDEKMGLKDTVQFIQNRTREALMARFGVDRITGPSPETDKYLKTSIAAEAEAAILKEMATGNRSALDWYTKAIEDAIKEASGIYPMLRDDDVAKRLSNSRGINSKEDARVMFTLALSITSQNMKVRDNARATTEQFDTFLQTGRFDPSRKYGTKAPSIASNLALANYMFENVFDGKAGEFGQFLNTEFTVAELNALGRKVQAKNGLDKPPFKISGELANEMVYGSAIFGPKIGNGFYQNLNRNFSPVTIDLWFMRLWGRLTGTLVGNDTAINKQIASLREAVEADAHPTTKVPDGYAERFNEATDAEVIGLGIELAADWERQYKALQKQGMTSNEITEKGLKPEWAFKAVAIAGQLKPNDAPNSGAQRKWIRDVVAGSVKMLAQKGYNVTPADLQALVWYPEKDFVNLFKEGKLESNLNVSYDTAFSELAAVRNSNATSANTDARDGGRNSASRQGDGGRSSGQANVGGVQALAEGAVEEEGDQVRRTLSTEVRNRLIDQGSRYSGRNGRGAGSNRSGEIAPLEGAPTNGGGPIAALVEVAENYALENGIPLTRQSEYAKIDENFSRRLAQAYEEMQDAPTSPAVREAYADLIQQTRSQYDALVNAGYEFTLFDDDSDPYATNPWEAMRDLRNNKRMAVYSSVAGYGSDGAIFDVEQNPMLADSGLKWKDQSGVPRKVLANDLFRAVHDAFGHGLEGAGFRARGEENAWQAHARLFTGPAVAALTSETRGQNSWVNYGPNGDTSRNAGLFDTVFAPQKIGLMPEWTWSERVVDGPRDSGRTSRAVYTPERTDLLLQDLSYPDDDNKTKAWITFMSPDQFLGLTLSNKGRDLLATMDPEKTRARPLNVDELRRVDQPLFLEIADPYMASGKEQPRRVMGHEGRHRMAAFKAAGIDQVPVILRRQDGRGGQLEDLNNFTLAPQRGGRSDQYNSGDTNAVLSEAIPFNYANAGRIREMMADGDVRFSGRRGRGNAQSGPKALRPNAPKFKTGPSVLGVDPMAAKYPRLVNWYEKLVNRTRSVKQLTKNIDDFYNDKTNIDRAEQLMGSRAAYTTQEFHLNELKPVLKEIGKQGLSINEVETYMHNRHAVERNAIIRERNDAFQDGGSGINDAAAKAYLSALSPAKRNRLEAVAKKLDVITNGTLQVLQDSGIESAETIRNLRNAYKFYVPLFREGVDGGHALGTRGASVEGSALKAAVGSSKPVSSIIANIVTQREAAINRAEANRLGNTVFQAALENGDQAFWMVIDPSTATPDQVRKQLAAMGMDPDLADDIFKSPTKRAYNKRTGNVDTIADTSFKRQPNVFATRVDGTDKFIVFNPNEKMAADIATVLKNDDLPTLEGASAAFIDNVGRITRLWSQLRTQYMPEFGPVNFARDIWGVMVNLTSTPLDGEQFKVMTKAPLYAKKLVRVIRATDSGEPVPAGSQEVADLFDRFEKAGGRTAIRESFFKNFDRDPEKLEAELQKAVKQLAAGKTSAPKVVVDYVTAWNDALENATRLATFKIAVDKGMTDAQAAEIAKNITVNFNQKGQWTREINSLYGFANASIASTDRNIKTMLGKAGKKILIGGVGLGVIQGLLLAAAGYDEDDVPEWVKDHAFVIPLGLFADTTKYVAIPMPYFYNMFPAIGRRMVEAARGQLTAGQFIGGTAEVMINSVNPIAYGAGFIEFISPSVFDMFVQYAQNEDGLGRRIYNKDFNDLNPTTGMSRARGDTTVMYAMYSKAAEVINAVTGGDEYEVGGMSPTPEEIKFFVEQFLPPMQFLYRSTATLEKGVSGEQIEANDIAFVRRFYGEVGGKTAEGGKFYDNVKAVNELKNTVKLRDEAGEDTTDIFDENPKAELIDYVGQYYRDVSDLRRERRKMILNGAKPSETQTVDDNITILMTEFNNRVEEAEARK